MPVTDCASTASRPVGSDGGGGAPDVTGSVRPFGWTVGPGMALTSRLTIVKLFLEVLLNLAKLFYRCTDVRAVDDVDLHTLADSR